MKILDLNNILAMTAWQGPRGRVLEPKMPLPSLQMLRKLIIEKVGTNRSAYSILNNRRGRSGCTYYSAGCVGSLQGFEKSGVAKRGARH